MGKKDKKDKKEQEAAELLMKHLTEQIRGAGLNVASIKVHRFDPKTGAIETKVLEQHEMEKPAPHDGGIGDFLPWETWARINKDLATPGWAVCRFCNRGGSQGEIAGFVFGIARERFGIWAQPYPVCHLDTPENHQIAEHGPLPDHLSLPAITFLPNGMSLAMFDNTTTAIRATEIADRVIGAVDDFDPKLMHAIYQQWEFHGLRRSPHVHAHYGPGGAEFPVWITVGADVDKPEVVS